MDVDRALLRRAYLGLGPSIPVYNTYIKYGCIAANSAVFLAWQFALRNGIMNGDFWAWLDRKLRTGSHLRVRSWLERNFMFRSGDERIRPWTMITNAFSHIDSPHLAANLVSFSAFADQLLPVLSPIALAGLVMTTAVAANIGFLIQEGRRKFPDRHVRALGLSGVVMGLGAAASVLFPTRQVITYGIRMPLVTTVMAYTAVDLLFLDSKASTTGHAAHIGGAVAGAAYILILKRFNLVKGMGWYR